MHYNPQAPQPAQPQQQAPAGWYPDPVGGGGQRYWDGIAWSTEFTRAAPPQQFAAPTQLATAPKENSSVLGIALMAIGGLFILARVVYWSGHSAVAGSSAYASGAVVGNIIGMLLGAAIFISGYAKHRNDQAERVGEAPPIGVQQRALLTIGLTVIAVFAANFAAG
jgi:hypothetical protein